LDQFARRGESFSERIFEPSALPKPAAVDKQSVLETLLHGGGHVNVVQSGLQVLNETGKDGWLIANAIIVVSIDDGK
jgi:hypothetical protein